MEQQYVVDTLRLNYQGLFSMEELLGVIDRWLAEKGYEKYDKKNYETVFEDSRQLEVEMEPWRNITEEVKFVLKINLLITGLKDTVILKDKHREKLNEGKMLFTFDAIMETDLRYRWEGKGWLQFVRTLFDQFIYKGQQDRFEVLVAQEVEELYYALKSHLNLYKY